MQIEYVARICLAAGRAAQQQRQRAVGDCVLGQIVVDDEHIASLAHEILTDRRAGIRRDILLRRTVRRSGGNDDAVIERAVFLQRAAQTRDRGRLLTDGNVNADHVLSLLVQDGVDGDGGLAGLAVADDQLALTASDRHHRIDGKDAGLHGLVDRLARYHARSLAFDRAALGRFDRAEPVDRLAEGVDRASDQCLTDRNVSRASGAGNGRAFMQAVLAAEQHYAHAVALEVEHNAAHAGVELHQFAVDRAVQSVYGGDAVADLDDRTGLVAARSVVILFDLLAENG